MTPKRPLPITILCVLFFTALSFSFIAYGIYFINSDILHSGTKIPIGKVIWNIFNGPFLALISTVGLWKMYRWSVYLYFGGYTIKATAFYIFSNNAGQISINNNFTISIMIIIPIIYSIIVLPYWKRMKTLSN